MKFRLIDLIWLQIVCGLLFLLWIDTAKRYWDNLVIREQIEKTWREEHVFTRCKEKD